jgi:hypothetical protein
MTGEDVDPMERNTARTDAYRMLKEHFGLKWQQRDTLDALERSDEDVKVQIFNGALLAALTGDWAKAQRWLEEGGVLQPGLVRGTDNQMHAASAYYDGECAYAWECYCGAAETDASSLDTATEWSTLHLDNVGALVSA